MLSSRLNRFCCLWLLLINVVLIEVSQAQAKHPLNPGAPKRPNIVLIVLDDADVEQFGLSFSDRLFPNIMQLARVGMTFRNMHATTPICGPSRACLYRGQYAHNTRICINTPGVANANNFDGGFKFYHEQGYFDNDLSVWMHDAGYRTMMVGKYLHSDFEPFVPTSWDDYYYSLGAKYFDTARFTNRTNPNGAFEKLAPEVYRTTAEADDAVRLLKQHVARADGKPFFLSLNPFGPHLQQYGEPFMIERHHETWWVDAQQPYSESFNEADFTDKRGFFKNIPVLPKEWLDYISKHYRDRMLATRSVDDMVGRITKTLKSLGVADNTYVFVTSDNGFELGHHRFVGKGLPTHRSSNLPLFVSGPNVDSGSISDHLLGHIDLAPTIAELASASIPKFVDGRSFNGILSHRGSNTAPPIRDVLLIENWETLHVTRGLSSTASTAIRFPDSVYTEWANGERDFYDLKSDPEQIENSYDSLSPARQTYLSLMLRTLKNPARLPVARFSMPFSAFQNLPRGTVIRGTAEDPVGVTQVKLAIQNTETDQYWNGKNWQAEFAQFDAELENPAGQITNWTCSSLIDEQDSPSSELVAYAWAYDKAAESSPPSVARFKFE